MYRFIDKLLIFFFFQTKLQLLIWKLTLMLEAARLSKI